MARLMSEISGEPVVVSHLAFGYHLLEVNDDEEREDVRSRG